MLEPVNGGPTTGLSPPSSKALLRDLAYYVPSKVVPAAVVFLTVVLLTHSLTPEEFGIYASVIALLKLTDTFALGWLRQSALRFFPEYRAANRLGSLSLNLYFVVLGIISVESVIVYLGVLAFGFHLSTAVLAVGVVIALTSFNFLLTLLQSARLSRHYGVASLIQSFTQIFTVTVFVFLLGGGCDQAIAAIGIGYLVSVVYGVVCRCDRQAGFERSLTLNNWDFAKRFWAYGAPMSAYLLSFQTLYFFNRLVIGIFRSQAEVGVFSSAYDLINGSISLAMTPVLLAVHPLVMQIWAETKQREPIEKLIAQVGRYILILAAIFLFWAFTFMGDILHHLLGSGFGVENWVVGLLALSAFTAQFSMLVHKGLEIAARTKTMMGLAGVAVVFNVVLNLLFVEAYGYHASVVISFISYLIYMALSYWVARHYVKLTVSGMTVIRLIISVAIAFLSFSAIQQLFGTCSNCGFFRLAVGLLLCTITYFVSLLLLGEFVEEKEKFMAYLELLGRPPS